MAGPGKPVGPDGYIHESKHAVLACYHRDNYVRGGRARVDVRLNGGALRPLWLLNVILLVAGIYLARNADKNLSGAVSLFAAIPAGLVALATQSKHELTAELGKWVRRSQVLLSVLAGAVGLAAVGDLVSGDGRLAGMINDERVAALLAGYAAASSGILGYICFRRSGPASGPTGTVSYEYADVSDYRRRRRRASLLVVLGSTVLAAAAIAAAVLLG